MRQCDHVIANIMAAWHRPFAVARNKFLNRMLKFVLTLSSANLRQINFSSVEVGGRCATLVMLLIVPISSNTCFVQYWMHGCRLSSCGNTDNLLVPG